MVKRRVLFQKFVKKCLRECGEYPILRVDSELTVCRKDIQGDPNLKCTVEVSYLEIYNGNRNGWHFRIVLTSPQSEYEIF